MQYKQKSNQSTQKQTHRKLVLTRTHTDFSGVSQHSQLGLLHRAKEMLAAFAGSSPGGTAPPLSPSDPGSSYTHLQTKTKPSNSISKNAKQTNKKIIKRWHWRQGGNAESLSQAMHSYPSEEGSFQN